MSTDSYWARHPLPEAPNLRPLKNEARDLFMAGAAASLANAQLQIARLYAFASWPKLKAHVESLEEIGQLKHAINANDIARVKTRVTHNPALHQCSTWLRQGWAAHVGCRMSRTFSMHQQMELAGCTCKRQLPNVGIA